jgi:hypothetical protein
LESMPYGIFDTVFYAGSKPAPQHVFLGRVYVLINGMSISTTGLFCNSLRKHRGAVFVGQAGGFTTGGTYGQVLPFRLKHSGITGYMSTIRFVSDKEVVRDTLPFYPDIYVIETIHDIISKRDAALERTLEFIKGRK